MPFLFLVVGIVMVVSAVRGTQSDLLTLLKGDFTGKGNFIYWTLAILFIGALGYIPDFKPVSRAFLALVVIVLFLSNGGVFTKFVQAVQGATQSPSQTPTSTTQQSSVPSNPSGGLPSLGTLSNLPSEFQPIPSSF